MSTYKQKLAASKLVENGGNIGKAMIDAGYSPKTAKTPQKLTNSMGFRLVLDKLIPDIELLKKHKELLYANKISSFDFGKGREAYVKPDYRIRIKALDMYYKIKGYYRHDANPVVNDPYANMSDEELINKAKELEKKIKRIKSKKISS